MYWNRTDKLHKLHKKASHDRPVLDPISTIGPTTNLSRGTMNFVKSFWNWKLRLKKFFTEIGRRINYFDTKLSCFSSLLAKYLAKHRHEEGLFQQMAVEKTLFDFKISCVYVMFL